MNTCSPALRLALTLAAIAAFLPALGAEPATGDLWQVTSQPKMEGVPVALPSNTVKVCSPKDWTEPPGAADERRKCVNSDMRKDGAKVYWKVTCAGPPAMTGTGEITRDGEEAWSGTIRFTSSEGAMTIALSGTRVGPCEVK